MIVGDSRASVAMRGSLSSNDLRIWRLRVFIGSVTVSALVGALQVVWAAGAFGLAHSLTVWLLLAIAASARGSLLQAFISTVLALVASVVAFFVSWTLTDDAAGAHTGGMVSVYYTLVWVCAAVPAAAACAVIAGACRRPGIYSGVAGGMIAGFAAGDVLLTRVGTEYSRIVPEVISRPDLLTGLGVIAALASIGWTCWFNRRQQTLWLACAGLVAGLPLGYALSRAPLILHAFANHVWI